MKAVRQLVITLTIVLTGCADQGRGSDPEPVDVTEDSLITAIADEAILPAVTGFSSSAQALQSVAESFCNGVSAQGLGNLQGEWRDVLERWYRLSLYNFGPLNNDIVFPPYTFVDGLRLRGTDYTETIRSEISNDITGDQQLTDDYFAAKTFQRVGLLALESAIFETSTPEHSRATADILAEYEFQPRKCEVLLGLSRQIATRARSFSDQWTVGSAESEEAFREVFVADRLEDGTESLTQVLLSAQEFLDYIQARRVALVAAQISMHSWQSIAATIDEVELLLRGRAIGSQSLFSAMEAAGGQNAISTVESSIEQVRMAITQRDSEMLEITLGFLDGNFKREIPDTLDVVLGISFSDGD